MSITDSDILPTLIALAVVTVASMVGSVSFALGKRLNGALPYLVSAAAGALLSTAMTHLIPEALDHLGSSRRVGFLLFCGFLFSFLLERVLWASFHHVHQHEKVCAHAEEEHHLHRHGQQITANKALAANVLFGGAIHSFIDGVTIATAFSVAHGVGLALTVAVLIHEVPHHIADVGVLVYSGMKRRRAVWWNLLATTGCLAGGLLVLLFGSKFQWLTANLLPITAANLIYVAAAILVPELQREPDKKRAALQVGCLLGAAGFVYWLGLVVRH